MELILIGNNLREYGILDPTTFECEVGEGNASNTFEITGYDSLNGGVYIPGTEYGGVIRAISGNTKEDMIQITGTTWRGMLGQRFICPPAGSDYFTVSGDLNACIRTVIGSSFGDLFTVTTDRVIRILSDYRFERYCSVLDGITKMLQELIFRMIRCMQFKLSRELN